MSGLGNSEIFLDIEFALALFDSAKCYSMSAAVADSTASILDSLDDHNLWVRREDVPVFDEHIEKRGDITEDFNEARLSEIAKNCNKRERDTGDLCPITLGHTVLDQYDDKGVLIRKAKETEQPPIVGYARNFRVGRFGPSGRLGILSTFYVKKENHLPDGPMSGDQILEQFPRRSVERWIQGNILDPIALLKRTPKRDLGILYIKDGADERIRYELEQTTMSSANGQATKPAPTAIRYEHEEGEGGEGKKTITAPQEGDEISEEDKKKAEQYMRYYERTNPTIQYMAQQAKQYAMASATNGVTPAPVAAGPGPAAAPTGNETMQMQRDQANIQYAREIEQLRNETKALREENTLRNRQYIREQRKAELTQLEAEGFKLNRVYELDTVAPVDAEPMAQSQYEKYKQNIRDNYSRVPTSDRFIPVDPGRSERGVAPDATETESEQEAAFQYMRDHNEQNYNKALAAIRKQ